MTVAELIAELQQFPADARVIVYGYEYGYCDAKPPQEKAIVLNANRGSSCGGPHDETATSDQKPDENAVLIG